MKRKGTVLAAAALLSIFFVQSAKGHDFSINSDGPVNDCSDVKFRISDSQAVTGEQRLQVGGNLLALRLGSSRGIPLKVTGSDRSGYELLLCKGAADAADLGVIRLAQRGAEVSVEGPDSEKWGGYLLVKAPRSAELDVETKNGPVSIDAIAGRVALASANGPVSLKNMGGTVTVEAKNGPISFSGRSGDVKLNTVNGPMTVQIDGSSWEGGELHAVTKNGPLSLRIPQQFATGIVVQKGSHAPFRCPTELCGERPPFYKDEERTVQIGSEPRRIHVGTENGPLTIGSAKK